MTCVKQSHQFFGVSQFFIGHKFRARAASAISWTASSISTFPAALIVQLALHGLFQPWLVNTMAETADPPVQNPNELDEAAFRELPPSPPVGIRLLHPGATRLHLLHLVCGFCWDNVEAGTIRILTNRGSLPIGRLIRNLTWPRQLTIEICEMHLYHQACQQIRQNQT